MRRKMTRGARVLLVFLFFTVLYLLAFFQVLSIPLLEDQIAQQILPVVSRCLICTCVKLTVIPFSSNRVS